MRTVPDTRSTLPSYPMPVSDHGGQETLAVTPQKLVNHLSPESALASSPLMKENIEPPSRFLNEKARASQASSFRLSRDMSSLRWDGSELQEADFNGTDERNEELDDQSAAGDLESDLEGNDAERPKGELGAAHYSTLSKRADFILAHAKQKLNLLEGNLGKARHSLNSPTFIPEARTSSSLSNYASPALVEVTDEADGTVKISPRFNFGTPRHLRKTQSTRESPGHLRGLSDTAVSPPTRMVTRNVRSVDLAQKGDQQNHATSPSSQSSTLNTVLEDQEGDKGSKTQGLRELYGASSPPPKSTQELRDQADELRRRISFLQRRSKNGAARSQYITDGPAGADNEHTFHTQVEALKQSLESQQAVIAQLEQAQQAQQPAQEDPRGEWQQVFDSNRAREENDGFSENEYFENDDDLTEDLPDILGDDDVDETEAMAAAHEDRVDAFDYETFILHSAMGRGLTRASSFSDGEHSVRSVSDGSETSVETEKGTAADEEEPQSSAGGADQSPAYTSMQQSNESMASLTTTQSFETANEDMSSDAESEDPTGQHEDLLRSGLRNPWPMPPQQINGEAHRAAIRESQVPTPRADTFPSEQTTLHTKAARPLSSIFQTLLVPDDSSELPRSLEKADAELIRRCADSLRSVCLEAIHPSTSPRDMKALRERLEVAKRVLNGEL